MKRARRQAECPRDPIGLSVEEAAAFIGVSPSTFGKAVEQGAMPRPRRLFGRVLWDADELRSAFRRLPRHGLPRQDAADEDGDDWSHPSL